MQEIRWHGRGGQGAFTVSRLLGIAVSLYEDQNALAFPSFGPERRGAPVVAFTKIAHQKINNRSEIKKCDYIVLIDETLFRQEFISELKDNGKIIINTNSLEKYRKFKGQVIGIDATKIALEEIGKPIANTAMLGALIGATDIASIGSVIKSLQSFLKGSALTNNIAVIKRAVLEWRAV